MQAAPGVQRGRAARPRAQFVVFAAAAVLLLVVASAVALSQGWLPERAVTIGRPAATPTPSSHSALVGGFVWQLDEVYGYQMLRPVNWESVDLGTSRSFLAPGSRNSTDGIELQAVNYEARFGNLPQTTSIASAEWLAFQQNPTLAKWSATMAGNWKKMGVEMALLRELADAMIYTYALPADDGPRRVLVAYKVDGSQPLGLVLTAKGAYTDLDWLEREGLVDDFVTMVKSARAIPADPRNIVPTLSQGTPTPRSGQPLDIRLWTSGTYADVDWLKAHGVLDDFVTMVESARVIPADARNVSPWLLSATPTRTPLCDVKPDESKIELVPEKPGGFDTLDQLVD